KLLVGGTMALTAGLMLLRLHVSQAGQVGGEERFHVRPALTVALGAAAGLLVGLTSIGSGSVIAAGLLLLYPRLATARVVGTDVAHAIPLVASATLGHLLFGQVHLALAMALIAGGIPGVVIGSYLASRVPNTALRGGLVVLLVATSATLLGASVPLIVAATALAAVVTVAVVAVRRQASDRLGVRVTGR
ncbi:MAG TPA: sulfite exporter TauE/SafE family protein, partial [Candidatus Dormibacteraeota bacterium]|nr:sulfite exporter TauE/SafE family protein [Candidatus Dormibacteraeota bacterium]